MRLVTTLLIVALAGCIAEPAQQTATQTISLPEATRSVLWNPARMDASDIWPLNTGIRSTQVFYRRGPDRLSGTTFLAFVVWNGSFVGKIYRVEAGDGADFRDAMGEVTARISGAPDFSTSSTGNSSAGPLKPTPGPQVDDLHFSKAYLENLKRNAAIILAASNDAINFDDDAKP